MRTVQKFSVADLAAYARESLAASAGYGVIWAQASGTGHSWWQQPGGGPIGVGGQMPWHLPQDLQWFKQVTSGFPVCMGSATWQSLPPRFRPLPGRQNLVLTSKTATVFPGATTLGSLSELAEYAAIKPCWVIGGGKVYAQTLAAAKIAVLTQLKLEVAAADTFAPHLPLEAGWQLTGATDPLPAENVPEYVFTVWERKTGYS